MEHVEHAEIHDVWRALEAQVGRVIVGQEQTLRLLFAALLTEGHVLLEGNPGTGKTLLARTLAASLQLGFRRIQFTPDLMPGDITGTNLFDFRANQFSLVRGPIFTEFLLADEINRTPPKTQAALLEAMQERSVTIDGTTYLLPVAFLVVATQNPIEHEGTYPLPEAELDRFLFKLRVDPPGRDEEVAMVRTHGHRPSLPTLDTLGLQPVCDGDFLARARAVVAGLTLEDVLIEYAVDLVRTTRTHPAVLAGASPRATNMLAAASRAVALLDGRTFVIPDDLKVLFLPTMRHRIVLSPEAAVEGKSADEVLTQILEQVSAPR